MRAPRVMLGAQARPRRRSSRPRRTRATQRPAAALLGHSGTWRYSARRGQPAECLRLYQAAAAVGEPVVKAHPGDAGWQRDLSASPDKVGDVRRDQGNLPAALASFRPRSLSETAWPRPTSQTACGSASWVSAREDRRRAHRPGRPRRGADAVRSRAHNHRPPRQGRPRRCRRQRDLSVSHSNVGNVLREQGNLPAALTISRPRSPSETASPKPTPETPDGSTTCRLR